MIPSLFPRDLELEPVRIGVVGLGYWGPNLIRNLQDLEASELQWICDLDRTRLQAIGKRYPAVRSTTSYDDLLADPELEAVAIATPVFRRFRILVLRAIVGSRASSSACWRARHRSRKRQFNNRQNDVLIDHGNEKDARRCYRPNTCGNMKWPVGGVDNLKACRSTAACPTRPSPSANSRGSLDTSVAKAPTRVKREWFSSAR